MVNRSALILVPLLLAGCNVQSKHERESASGDDHVTISENEQGNVSFDLPFAKGQVQLPGSIMAHGAFDIDGVKMYPGASINGFHVEAQNGRSHVNIEFKAPDAPDKVLAYFADQFRQKNVDASVSGDTITGTSKDGDSFTLQVEPRDGGGSTGTIRIDGKDGD